ncbi:MAG: hypothetical protein JWM85_2392 [Acidimicrobiaceae bacterium]|nr:hypothetical protein [Acidimicrobiaceae bacterium]
MSVDLDPTLTPANAAPGTVGAQDWLRLERRLLDWWQVLRRRPALVAVSSYALLGLVALYSVFPASTVRLSTCACGGAKDPVQTAWFLAWTPFALLHGHGFFVTNWLNYPVGVNLAQNTTMPLLGLLTAPITLTAGPVASENLLRWLAFPLSAWAAFFVARRLTGNAPAAWVAGLLYGFSPYMVAEGSVHLNLIFVPLPPLIFFAIYELVVNQQRSALRSGLVLGALCAAQFYVSNEVLATTALVAAMAVVLLALLRPLEVPRRLRHALFGGLVAAAVLGVCCGYAISVMTSGPLHYSGPAQPRHSSFGADLLGPILPTSNELLAPGGSARVGSRLVGGTANVDENGSYLGIPLLVATATLALWYRRERRMLFCLLVAVAAFVLSLGRSLHIDGQVKRLGLSLPFAAVAHLPLMDSVLPARMALYVDFFLAMALALGLAALARDRTARQLRIGAASPGIGHPDRQRSGRPWLAPVGLGGLLVVSLVSLLPSWPYRSAPAAPSVGVLTDLGSLPAGSTVLTYPYAAPGTDAPMLWQALTGMRFKLLGGYALRRGPEAKTTLLPTGLRPFDVQGMLLDALAPRNVPIPGVPYLAPSTETFAASAVASGGTARTAGLRGPTVSGVVESTSGSRRTFFVATNSGALVTIRVSRATRWLRGSRHAGSPTALARGERVTVEGRRVPAGERARQVRDLRSFLRRQHVDAVLVRLGLPGSNTVTRWVSAAIGAPTRSGSGAALWSKVGARLDRALGRSSS